MITDFKSAAYALWNTEETLLTFVPPSSSLIVFYKLAAINTNANE